MSEQKEVRTLREDRAGQGAHREVGSEGFAAKRRAVAEQGEPVGQIQAMPSLHYGGEGSTWGAWTQQGVCGRHGGEGACVTPGGLVRSRPTGSGTWAYKPQGEVAGDAVREVGVTRGTREPGKNTSPGIVPGRAVAARGSGRGGDGGGDGRRAGNPRDERRPPGAKARTDGVELRPRRGDGAATQTAPLRGKGSRWAWQAGRGSGRVGVGGLMVGAPMTETPALRTPVSARRGAR